MQPWDMKFSPDESSNSADIMESWFPWQWGITSNIATSARVWRCFSFSMLLFFCSVRHLPAGKPSTANNRKTVLCYRNGQHRKIVKVHGKIDRSMKRQEMKLINMLCEKKNKLWFSIVLCHMDYRMGLPTTISPAN